MQERERDREKEREKKYATMRKCIHINGFVLRKFHAKHIPSHDTYTYISYEILALILKGLLIFFREYVDGLHKTLC